MSQLQVIQNQEKSLLTESDVDILRKSKFKGFTDDEIAYASRFSSLVGLNPLLNQIHFVKRGGAVTAQVAIDGLRLTAQRAGGYAGSDEPLFEFPATDKEQKIPRKAVVTVYRLVEGVRCGFTGIATWDEYYSPVGGMWNKMPKTMLSKCAEAQALRKAFPAELASLYVEEEMHQADRPQKAQKIQEEIIGPKPIEAESRPVEQSPENGKPVCQNCGSDKLMVSKYHQGTHYCRDCKGTQAV